MNLIKISNPNLKEDIASMKIREEYQNLIPLFLSALKLLEPDVKVIEHSTKFPPNRSKLDKTLYRILTLKMEVKGQEVTKSVNIPVLLDHKYFLINGVKRIPMLQLCDQSIVRKVTPIIDKDGVERSTEVIRIQTNTLSCQIQRAASEDATYNIYIFGKTFPLIELFCCGLGFNETMKKFGIEWEFSKDVASDKSIAIGSKYFSITNYDKLTKEVQILCKGIFQSDILNSLENKQLDTDKFWIKVVGSRFTKEPKTHERRGGQIKDTLSLYGCDKFTKNQLKLEDSENIFDILTKALTWNVIVTDQKDLRARRVRFTEHLLSSLLQGIFDSGKQSLTAITNIAPKNFVKIKPTALIDYCQTQLVQYSSVTNPLSEISSLTKTTIIGPGGYNKESIPASARDLHESYFNRLCVIETPEGDNVGILSHLAINCELDENGKFV